MGASVEGLTATEMADLVISVTDAYPMGKNFEFLRNASIHSFELMNRIFTKEKIVIQGGTQISGYVVYKETGTAQFVLPGKVYQPSIEQVMKKHTVDWRHSHADWSVVREEILGCREPEELVGIIKPRRQACQMGLALLNEEQFWAAGDASSGTDPLTIPSFIVPIFSDQITDTGSYGSDVEGAFQGGLPTGFSDVSGIDPGTYSQGSGFDDATYERWRNWNANSPNSDGEYTETTEDRLERMFLNLNFESPDNVDDLKKASFMARRMYTNITTQLSMKRAAKSQNDQVGWDVSLDGGKNVMWKGIRPKWQKQLDTYSASRGYFPTYLVNFNALFPVVRKGEYFLEQTFGPDKSQPDMTTTHMDLSYNLMCTNRQAVGGVISYVGAE